MIRTPHNPIAVKATMIVASPILKGRLWLELIGMRNSFMQWFLLSVDSADRSPQVLNCQEIVTHD